MAQYLQSAYQLSAGDAYALAWSGVSDSSVWQNASDQTPFPLGDTGGSLTKTELNSNMSKFMDYEAFKTGIPVCQ
jgi:hypothetical protein